MIFGLQSLNSLSFFRYSWTNWPSKIVKKSYKRQNLNNNKTGNDVIIYKIFNKDNITICLFWKFLRNQLNRYRELSATKTCKKKINKGERSRNNKKVFHWKRNTLTVLSYPSYPASISLSKSSLSLTIFLNCSPQNKILMIILF